MGGGGGGRGKGGATGGPRIIGSLCPPEQTAGTQERTSSYDTHTHTHTSFLDAVHPEPPDPLVHRYVHTPTHVPGQKT